MPLKTDRPFAVQVTPGKEAKAVAFIIGILTPMYVGDVQKILRTVCAFFNIQVVA